MMVRWGFIDSERMDDGYGKKRGKEGSSRVIPIRLKQIPPPPSLSKIIIKKHTHTQKNPSLLLNIPYCICTLYLLLLDRWPLRNNLTSFHLISIHAPYTLSCVNELIDDNTWNVALHCVCPISKSMLSPPMHAGKLVWNLGTWRSTWTKVLESPTTPTTGRLRCMSIVLVSPSSSIKLVLEVICKIEIKLFRFVLYVVYSERVTKWLGKTLVSYMPSPHCWYLLRSHERSLYIHWRQSLTLQFTKVCYTDTQAEQFYA